MLQIGKDDKIKKYKMLLYYLGGFWVTNADLGEPQLVVNDILQNSMNLFPTMGCVAWVDSQDFGPF